MLHFFSLFYQYYHADFPSEPANCMLSPIPRSRCTRLLTSSHPYTVHLSNAKVNLNLHFFIHDTDQLWNSLPLSVFFFFTCLCLKLFFHKRCSRVVGIWTCEPRILGSIPRYLQVTCICNYRRVAKDYPKLLPYTVLKRNLQCLYAYVAEQQLAFLSLIIRENVRNYRCRYKKNLNLSH